MEYSTNEVFFAFQIDLSKFFHISAM